MKKSLGIIPARGGSKSIPWKNITNLHGKPLIAYTIEAALNSDLSRVVVSTDAEKIANVARDYNVEVMMRPAELARDDTPTLPVLQHVVETIDEIFDYIVCLQPTSPFRSANNINEALKLFENNQKADTLVSMVKVPHNMNPYSIMKLNEKGYLDKYINQNNLVLRRQEKPAFYARNGPAILTLSIDRLMSGKLYTGKTIPYLMTTINSIDIDTEEDILIADYMFDFCMKRG